MIGIFIGELHGRGGDRNAPLLLHGHPVGGRGFAPLSPLDHPGSMDHPRIKKQLFGKRRFSGIGVADDGKRAPFCDGFLK